MTNCKDQEEKVYDNKASNQGQKKRNFSQRLKFARNDVERSSAKMIFRKNDIVEMPYRRDISNEPCAIPEDVPQGYYLPFFNVNSYNEEEMH